MGRFPASAAYRLVSAVAFLLAAASLVLLGRNVDASLAAITVPPWGPVEAVPATAFEPADFTGGDETEVPGGPSPGSLRSERSRRPHPSDAVGSAVETFTVARVRRGESVSLHVRPGGKVVAEVDAITEFGSPQTLAVVERRGGWLGVTTPLLPNDRLGWVQLDPDVLRLTETDVSVTIDLSRKLLVVRQAGDVVKRAPVGIGRPESSTPIGRFAVTDKLAGSDYGPYYGCCILAISATQPNLPAGWQGGNRVAVHGTDVPATIGTASSAGCPRAAADDLRVLMRVVPLGAPVIVRA